ncbi:5'-nucleotidase C-terminal domain-containing protein [Flavobacteriales bacterium]|jgi:2',3'-cyclic-nucleotide 2'-phosphodiesterase (5'-nucleotidase family)|nr:5'-nucleotidase C-terminal domain-containing protein [Flavobacteriales bacterium]MDG1348340.1 5'-nucleotidase C-terminal domain-containing protein [Flavobacteriales bacterium]
MKLKLYYIYIGTLLFLACSPTYTLQSHEDKVVAIQASADSTALAIIAPYQNAIEEEMNEALTFTKHNLEKGRPQSTLGNFVTDLCLNYADAHICVMNNGGLRTTINKGNIRRGKLYELMPFENELVVLELDENDYLGLLNYICKRGGEPFSGISITMKEDGEIINYSQPVDFSKGEKVKVLTSDYLANGGDKMSFFQDKKQLKVGIKLRDAIIDYCSNTDTINAQLDGRLKVIEHVK